MKKYILILLILSSTLFAEVKNEYLSKEFIDSKIPIIDIRTTKEWIETGILKDSIPITFFDEQRQYDIQKFLTQLNTKVDTTKPFAIICRTGSRTKILAVYLSNTYNYKVTNVTGGIRIHDMKPEDLKFESYK